MNTILPKLGKKGSHTGMILSFVVFITSLIIIYSVVDIPSNDSLEKKYSIDILENNLIKDISHEMITVRINNNSSPTICVNFSTPKNSFSNIKIIAVNSSGSEIPSNEIAGITYIENADNLTKIYYMDETNFSKTLTSASSGCSPIEIKNVIYENRIFEGSILGVINETNYTKLSYNELKSRLGAPSGDEFKIQFIYSDTTFIGEFDINDIKTNIYVNEYSIDYISLDGEEKTGVIKIGLW